MTDTAVEQWLQINNFSLEEFKNYDISTKSSIIREYLKTYPHKINEDDLSNIFEKYISEDSNSTTKISAINYKKQETRNYKKQENFFFQKLNEDIAIQNNQNFQKLKQIPNQKRQLKQEPPRSKEQIEKANKSEVEKALPLIALPLGVFITFFTGNFALLAGCVSIIAAVEVGVVCVQIISKAVEVYKNQKKITQKTKELQQEKQPLKQIALANEITNLNINAFKDNRFYTKKRLNNNLSKTINTVKHLKASPETKFQCLTDVFNNSIEVCSKGVFFKDKVETINNLKDILQENIKLINEVEDPTKRQELLEQVKQSQDTLATEIETVIKQAGLFNKSKCKELKQIQNELAEQTLSHNTALVINTSIKTIEATPQINQDLSQSLSQAKSGAVVKPKEEEANKFQTLLSTKQQNSTNTIVRQNE